MNAPQIMRLTRALTRQEERDLKGHEAQKGDYHGHLITEPTIIVDAATERVQVVYLAPIPEDTRVLVDVLRHTDTPLTDRMSGMVSQWRTFGYRPRNAVRNPDCAPASLAADDPGGHAVICSFAEVVARYYAQFAPALYAQHQRKAARVLPQWKLEGTAFTSGIVNRDSALTYHFDSGNFKGVWSGMLGFKRDIAGGYLSVPAYDLSFEIADKSLLLFDGQGLLHGVTPFAKTSPQGYRLTMVYYSLASMWLCLPPGEEAQRHRRSGVAV